MCWTYATGGRGSRADTQEFSPVWEALFQVHFTQIKRNVFRNKSKRLKISLISF